MSERQIEGMARLSPTISWNKSNGLKSSAEPPEGNDRCVSHLELRSFLTTILVDSINVNSAICYSKTNFNN